MQEREIIRLDQSGFTLVELLISLVLTSLLFSSMLVVFQTQTRVNSQELDMSENQQNARVAMSALYQDVRQAGYFVDRFYRQPIWIDAAPYQLVFNANISPQFVAMHRDSAVPLSDGSDYQPGDYSAPPQEENLPAFLDRYLNESETIRMTLDRTYDGLVTASDVQEGSTNPNVYSLIKEINGNPPAILGYNIRGPGAYPDGSLPQPLFKYWGTFAVDDSLSLWGDSDGNGELSDAEITALTRVSVSQLPEIVQVDVEMVVETADRVRGFEGRGSSGPNRYEYRSYELRGRIRARNVGINPTGLLLCANPPDSPLNPFGYDTADDEGGSITISWSSSPDEYSGEDDVQFYSIYRKGPVSDFEVVGQLQAMGVDTTHVFVDDGEIDNFNAPEDGTEYYYYITAWDCAPQESVPSVTIGPIVSIASGPGSPNIEDGWDTSCDSGEDITLKFTASAQDDGTGSGVSSYTVYRGTVADGSIVTKILVDSLAATGLSEYEYHDTPSNMAGVPPVDDQPYFYIIRAVRNEVESNNSNEFGPVWSDTDLSAPRITSVTDKPGDDGTALIIEWRRSNSEDCLPVPDDYELQRRVKETPPWITVTTIPVALQNYYSFEDNNGGSGLVNGTAYEYQVLIKTSTASEASNVVEGTPLDNPPVGAPTNLMALDVACESDGDIQISWLKSPDDGAGSFTTDQYRLYRKVDGGSYSVIKTLTADGSPGYNWVDSEVNNPGNAPVLGNRYWYRVTAYDVDSSSESVPSNEDDALSDGSPGAPAVTAAYDTYSGGSREIRVEFTASADDGGCSDNVTLYHIYRTTTPGSYGSYIGTVTAIDAAAYTWTDNAANSTAPPLENFSYYYMIRAYDGVNMEESLDSNEFGPVESLGANCDCCIIFFDDFESGNVGWTHGGTRDDWQLGHPWGDSYDPDDAYSGNNVWANDLGWMFWDGQYRSNADNWLESPTFDLSAFEEGYVILSFYRWLSVERQNDDEAKIQVNTGSGWERVWRNTSDYDTIDDSWNLQYVDLSPWALGQSSVKIRFTLQSDGSQQFGGWTIDDVQICYTAPAACNYFSYVTDVRDKDVFFELTNESGMPVDLLGVEIGWAEPTSRLKKIETITGPPTTIWSANPTLPSPVEAIFDSPVSFTEGEMIEFKFKYEPGNMKGTAVTIKFITACGTSSVGFIQLP